MQEEKRLVTASGHFANFFGALSPLKKLLLVGAILLSFALLATGGGIVGDKIRAARYNRREAARMKQVQAALAAADAAEQRAELKEAQAAEIAKQSEAKAGSLKAADAEIQRETKDNEQKIEGDFHSEIDRINRDASTCDRCRDVCSKLDSAARANPDFGQYRCAADACAEECPGGDPSRP